ncbi:MAG: DinB family protein [Anaerolineae bacterium]
MVYLCRTALDILDAQREAVLAMLDGLPEARLWQRPAPGEWSSGEILSHTERFFSSFLPGLRLMWSLLGWYGRLRRERPFKTQIENVYKRPNFPMWTGFLWKPRHTPEKPVSLATLVSEIEAAHERVHAFYAGKDLAVLGNVHAYDPAIGVVNLITALKVGIDHDQLHYGDVIEMAASHGDGGLSREAV